MKARTIMRGKRITQYFMLILLLAMVYNMVTGALELAGNPNAAHAWYWALIGVGAIYAVPLLVLLVAHLFFRSRANRLNEGKPRYRP